MTHLPLKRRTLLAGALALGALPARSIAAVTDATDWHALGEDVRAQMRWAWGQYRERAWGMDQIKPISGGAESFPMKTHHLGLTLIEAMDTLWVMGLDAEFADALAWTKTHLDFAIDGDVSVFETSIRIVGGLLSAHHACGDPSLLTSARDMADRLLPAFDTPTGMPHRFINLKTGATRDPATNPAEVGTFLPEWGTLSRLTGDPRYHDVAKRAVVALFDRRSKLDLFGDKIDADTGRWLGRRASVGSGADSFYEYLWDSWQLLGDADCKRMYDACTRGILAHQQDRRDGHLWFPDIDFETGRIVSTDQDELASFYGGLLAQGGARDAGAAYTRAWASVQDRVGILPESYDYATRKPTSLTNALRPELADAAFNLWLLDRSPEWRIIGHKHFLAMKQWNRAPYGFAAIADVTQRPMTQADHCPAYWWSEQMKYYYLLFSDTPRFDYANNYLSTEGNVLRGFVRPPVGPSK